MGRQNGTSPEAAVLDGVRRLVRAQRESSREAQKRAGVSGAQLFVLQKLRESAALSLGELSERTLTHQSSVSVVVHKLVEAGLVARKKSKRDARRLELSLTARGRALLKRAPRLFQDKLLGALDGLRPAARAGLGEALQDLCEAMGIAEGPAAMFSEEPG